MKTTARRLRHVLVSLLLAATLPVLAQSAATEPAAPTRPAAPVTPQISDAALLAALRAGGLVVYFRHTATDFSRDDRQMRDFDDCRNQRPLSPKGRADARAIGEQWKRLKIPVGPVLASPYCRTSEVAQLMFGRYERSNDVRGGPVDAGEGRYAGLKRLLSTPRTGPDTLVISSHGNPWRALSDTPYLVEGEAVILRPQGAGSWEVLAQLKAEDWARLKESSMQNK